MTNILCLCDLQLKYIDKKLTQHAFDEMFFFYLGWGETKFGFQ